MVKMMKALRRQILPRRRPPPRRPPRRHRPPRKGKLPQRKKGIITAPCFLWLLLLHVLMEVPNQPHP